MTSSLSNKIKMGVLLIILLSIPVVTLLNQQVQNSLSFASEWSFWGRRSNRAISFIGYVYEDKNRNQMKDADENGIKDVGISIYTKARRNNEGLERKNRVFPMVYTDSLGFFKYTIPRNSFSNSVLYSFSIQPPAGYVLTTNPRLRRVVRRKAQRVITIGIAQEEAAPTTTAAPTATTTETPTNTPTQTPAEPNPTDVLSPTEILTETPTQTPMPTVTPTPTMSLPACPQPPVCEGELITINQENILVCPLYICYSSTE